MRRSVRNPFSISAGALRSSALLKSFALAITISGTCSSVQAAEPIGSDTPNSAVDLGRLTPFYRATQLQGHILGSGLEPIPAYLVGNDIDLKYRRNPRLSQEVPFADTINIARFLGGYRTDWLKKYGSWTDALGNESDDYVVKGNGGALIFRPEIIARRLKPYLDAGYRLSDITLGIENTPWAIARNGGKEGLYGQLEPPADWGLWQTTLQHFAADFKKLYGASAAPNFKMGDEYDTRKSFDGSASDYLQYYSIGYRVLHAAFPSSQIAPGEFTGLGTCTDQKICSYDEKEFLNRAELGGVPPSYVPRSLNSFQGKPNATTDLTIWRAVSSYGRLGNVVTEIHQFGLLGQPFGSSGFESLRDLGTEQGPREAAWQFIVLMALQEKLHPRRMFHWLSFYSINKTPVELLSGTGFVDLALDRYLGMEMFRLPVISDGSGELKSAAIEFQSGQRRAVIVATSNLDVRPSQAVLQIDFGNALTSSQLHSLRVIRYSEDRNVFMQIKSDLADDRNLKPEFNSCALCTAELDHMALDRQRAVELLKRKNDSYVEAIKSDLRFRNMAEIPEIKIDGQKLDLNMRGNEILIFETQN